MKETNSEVLLRQYDASEIEIYQTESRLIDQGWINYIVITAWNPRSKVLSLAENRELNLKLYKDLVKAGAEILKAIGRSTNWEWFEESFAVKNLEIEVAVKLGQKYNQNALFYIHNGIQEVILCSS